MYCNVMNYNDDALEGMMKGADILYSMLDDLTRSISCLPDCKGISQLKMMSKRIENDSNDVCEIMRGIYNYAVDVSCDTDELDDEYADENISQGGELQELLALLGAIFSSGNPVSISADIYINENREKENTAECDDEERNGD